MAIQLEPPAAVVAERSGTPAVRPAVPPPATAVPPPAGPSPVPPPAAVAATAPARPPTARPPTGPVIGGVPVLPPPLPGFQRPFPIRRIDPITASDRMLVLCGWATALGLIGLATALRAVLSILDGTAPGWYEPTLAGLGSTAIGLTAAAFPVVRRPRLPWLLLCVATASVLIDVGLTVAAR